MLQGLIIKKIKDAVESKLMKGSIISKILKYVDEDNELDIQMKQVHKNLNKYGRELENMEKDIAKLRVNSHPPVFMKDDYKNIIKMQSDIIKRLIKLEKRR
jgi:hypothetical protein